MSNGLTQPERRSEKRRLLKGTESELYLSIYGYASLCSSVFWRFRTPGTDELDLSNAQSSMSICENFFTLLGFYVAKFCSLSFLGTASQLCSDPKIKRNIKM